MKQLVKSKNWFAYGLALSVLVIVYGAIPFFSIPHLGSVVWTSGFAKSFLNAGWPAIRAVNFGVPEDAAMAFGLAGAFLQSTFMALFRLHASDAYALGALCWLGFALWGCIRLGKMLGASVIESCFLSLVYLTLPFIWVHANYGILSFGFALLPLYLQMSFSVVQETLDHPKRSWEWYLSAVSFTAVSLLSIFIDGYSFVMFFTACGVIWVVAFLRKDSSRNFLLIKALPTILISALLSYSLYTLYVGTTNFPPSSMDFFRAWGIDVTMLLVPSRGTSWLWDVLGVSVERSSAMFFGDDSVWLTTFALPLIMLGGIGYWFSRKNRFALPLLLVALMGLYFSLGPSLKINSMRPVNAKGEYLVQGALMPEDVAIAPTGSEIIYGHIPGFTNMRATYRWSGLMFVALFGLTVLFYLGGVSRGQKPLAVVIVGLLVLSNLPNLPQRLAASKDFRAEMYQMDKDFDALSRYIGRNAVVFFAPPGNDMIVNYLATIGNYRAYNIGGDKNVEMAREHWPEVLGSFKRAGQHPPSLEKPERCFSDKISQVLQGNIADFVVLPYFDMLWGAHAWPWPSSYVDAQKKEFLPTIDYFQNDPLFAVKKGKFYTVISLSSNTNNGAITEGAHLRLNQPVSIWASCRLESFFTNGWHAIESWGVWSSESAGMVIPIGEECQDGNGCSLRMTFRVFDATKTAPKTVLMEIEGVQVARWSVDTGKMQEYILPLRPDLAGIGPTNEIRLTIHVPDAISPDEVSDSADTRILGIGLSQLELKSNANSEDGN